VGHGEVVGTQEKLSMLSCAEEYLRALSCQNDLKEMSVDRLTHHYTYTIRV